MTIPQLKRHPATPNHTNKMTNAVLTAFGLASQESLLLGAFDLTNAYIGGSAALYWYLNDIEPTKIPSDTDLDIFFRPKNRDAERQGIALFNAIFETAGYSETFGLANTRRYTNLCAYHIASIRNWYHPVLERAIQLIIRKLDTPEDALPAYALADFDICQLFVTRTPAGCLGSMYNDTHSVVTDDTVLEFRNRRMRIGHLKDQILYFTLNRLHKYYSRGFAFEAICEDPCSCACGHKHTVKKYRRLTIEEAIEHVTEEHRKANPPAPADAIRPPPLEIPALDIHDSLLETPPRRRATKKVSAPPRLIRNDKSWIRTNKPTE